MNVLTLVCRDRAHPETPMAPDALPIDDLCTRPSQIAEVAGDADRLVLVLHDGEYVPGQLQKHCRSAGVDPIGVQVIMGGDAGDDPERLSVLVAGARARAAAYTDAEPDQMRPVIPTTLSRRSLLSIPQPVYEAVPRIDSDVCAAEGGCRACVGVCPQNAYRWVSGAIVFDKDACVACGQCVTTCPTGAIENPTVGAGAIGSHIAALIEASADPVGIAFVCRQRTKRLTAPGWYPVEVPCTAMVPATWLLGALTLGAAAATVLPCSASGCPLGFDQRSAEALRFARDLATAVGLGDGAIPVEPGALPEASATVPGGLLDPFGVHGPVEVVAAFTADSVGDDLVVAGPGAPMGIVTIDPSSCTMCTMCASTCPTGALQIGGTPEEMEITFDAGRCTACNQCVPICPEVDRGAITLDRKADVGALRAGRVTLNRTETLACEICGKPVAPTAMMNRIASILGDEYAKTMDYLNRRCMDCRGS